MNPFATKPKSSKRDTLLRWLRSREQRTVELQSFSLYWKLLSKVRAIAFFLRSTGFKSRWSLKERKEWTLARIIVVKGFIRPLLFALLCVFVIEMAAYLLMQNKSHLKPYTPDRIIRIWDFLKGFLKTDPTSYRVLLGPLITVSGAFLGLYFTALNVLLSSAYKQVTSDIRGLIMRDKVGDAYIQIVAFTGAYSVILFGLIVIGYTPSFGSLVLLITLGVSEIYCFISQWLRVTQFFDPSTLVFYLSKDLIKWIEEATTKGRWWLDASFQAHFQKRAEQTLNTYRNLIITVRGEEHLRSQSLIKLSNSLLRLLTVYEFQKDLIPSQSKWFKTIFQYKDWLTASHSETSIATQTGTALFPNEIPDLLWVEKEIGKIIDFALKGFLEKKDLLNALTLFQHFQNVTKNLARNHSIDEALLLFRIIKVNTEKHSQAFDVPNLDSENDLDPLRFTLALVDFCALSFINILLGLAEGAERMAPKSFTSIIASANQTSVKSLYRTGLPRKVLQQLESTKKYLDFERVVEGKALTPQWFQLQLVTLSYLHFLESTFKSLIVELDKVFLGQAKSLVEQKKHLLAIHLIERGFEACNKFAVHFTGLQRYCAELDQARKLNDIPWVNFPWEQYQKTIADIHKELIELFSTLLHPIIKLPRLDDFPDHFGHAYTVLTDECLKSMISGNEDLFKKIFPVVFLAALEAHDRHKKLEIVDVETRVGLLADPIIDLFDLSGYALIFDELDGKDFWSTVRGTWDKYLAGRTDRLELIKLFITLGTHHQFLMFPRSITRTSWQQQLQRVLRQRGLMREEFFDPFSNDQEEEKHSSKIIQMLTRSIMLHEEARDLFVVTYFKAEIQKAEIEIPDGMRDLYERLNEEEKDEEEV